MSDRHKSGPTRSKRGLAYQLRPFGLAQHGQALRIGNMSRTKVELREALLVAFCYCYNGARSRKIFDKLAGSLKACIAAISTLERTKCIISVTSSYRKNLVALTKNSSVSKRFKRTYYY
jgi:hypothetical protein